MFGPVAGLLFLVGSFYLGQMADRGLSQDTLFDKSAVSDPMTQLLGSSKEAFGDTLFIKADEYFHGGVMHDHHHDESKEELSREGVFLDKEHAEDEGPQDWIGKINHQVHAHDLMHLTKDERKEMLPFFALSTQLDPYNVEAILTSAYWLHSEFQKKEEAIQLLQKGIQDNPKSWELENAIAKIYDADKKDWAEAEAHYRKAKQKAIASKTQGTDMADLYYHWAGCLLNLGHDSEALQAFEDSTKYFGPWTTEYFRQQIQQKIKELRGND